VIVLDPASLEVASVDAIVARHEFALAWGSGALRGNALAAALHCDWLILREGTRLAVDSPRAWSGAVWRIGGGALRLVASGGLADAEAALAHGLCDAVVDDSSDPLKWIGGRSRVAIDAAAALIRRRGGDVLERAEFARLFATGEPQRGLAAFLARRKPEFI
jgi:enoyl-CoA hydratase/carnithine racemase